MYHLNSIRPTHTPDQAMISNAIGRTNTSSYRIHQTSIRDIGTNVNQFSLTSQQLQERMNYHLRFARRRVRQPVAIVYDLDDFLHVYPLATGERSHNPISHRDRFIEGTKDPITGKITIGCQTGNFCKMNDSVLRHERAISIHKIREVGVQAGEFISLEDQYKKFDEHKKGKQIFKPANLRINISVRPRSLSTKPFEILERKIEITNDTFSLYHQRLFHGQKLCKYPPRTELNKYVSGPVWSSSFPMECNNSTWGLVKCRIKCSEGRYVDVEPRNSVPQSTSFKPPSDLLKRRAEFVNKFTKEKLAKRHHFENLAEQEKRRIENLNRNSSQLQTRSHIDILDQTLCTPSELTVTPIYESSPRDKFSTPVYSACEESDYDNVPSPTFSVLTEYEPYVAQGQNVKHINLRK